MNEHSPPVPKTEYLKWLRATEVDGIDPPALYREFVAFLEAGPGNLAHYYRYCQTFRAMTPYLQHVRDMHILETGSFCPITRFLASNGAHCQKTSSDLRYEIDAESNSADMLLSLEVIEHIKDQTEKTISEIVLFRGTGVRQYANEIFRVLKPGGLLVLTTPNPCSAIVLSRLIDNRPPMVFRPHVREYTRDELIEIFAAFVPVEVTTRYSFFLLSHVRQMEWAAIFERNGWEASMRGDDHFAVFRKPI